MSRDDVRSVLTGAAATVMLIAAGCGNSATDGNRVAVSTQSQPSITTTSSESLPPDEAAIRETMRKFYTEPDCETLTDKQLKRMVIIGDTHEAQCKYYKQVFTPITTEEIRKVTVTGDTARVTVGTPYVDFTSDYLLVKENGRWKIDGVELGSSTGSSSTRSTTSSTSSTTTTGRTATSNYLGYWTGAGGKQLALVQGPDGVISGAYETNDGVVTGEFQGNTFVGRWCEVGRQPEDHGLVEFAFTDDSGKTVIRGRWKYASESATGNWHAGWDLQDHSTGQAPTALETRANDVARRCPK